MSGGEKLEAALSPGGSPETPAVICYEGIYTRDHWDALTSRPWWYLQSYDIGRQLEWQREYYARTPGDWMQVTAFPPREVREASVIEQRPGGVYRVDRRSGAEERLEPPVVSGWNRAAVNGLAERPAPPATGDEVDAAIPDPEPFDPDAFLAAGGADLATAKIAEFGPERLPLGAVSSPLWRCHHVWGFRGLMTLVADEPDLIARGCRRLLAHSLVQVRRCAAVGAKAMWLEECFTALISPAAFAEINAPLVAELVEEIRRLGMKSIYYYCGDPSSRWEQLFGVGADALALEEGKKGFTIDVEEVVDRAAGRCAVLGNLDAIGLLAHGSQAELRTEIARQIAAGRRNGGRFVMSIGSPVTPGTSVERGRQYLEIARELGSA